MTEELQIGDLVKCTIGFGYRLHGKLGVVIHVKNPARRGMVAGYRIKWLTNEAKGEHDFTFYINELEKMA